MPPPGSSLRTTQHCLRLRTDRHWLSPSVASGPGPSVVEKPVFSLGRPCQTSCSWVFAFFMSLMIRNYRAFFQEGKGIYPGRSSDLCRKHRNQVFMPVCADSLRSKEYQLIKLRSLAMGSYSGLNKKSLFSFMILTVLNVSSLGHGRYKSLLLLSPSLKKREQPISSVGSFIK